MFNILLMTDITLDYEEKFGNFQIKNIQIIASNNLAAKIIMANTKSCLNDNGRAIIRGITLGTFDDLNKMKTKTWTGNRYISLLKLLTNIQFIFPPKKHFFWRGV